MSGESPALDQLEMYADESIGATYGTLSASLVAQLVSVARDDHAAELAEAEKRGAVRVLREAEETMSWFGAQGNLVNPDTAWAGISACMRVLKEQADRMEDENG